MHTREHQVTRTYGALGRDASGDVGLDTSLVCNGIAHWYSVLRVKMHHCLLFADATILHNNRLALIREGKGGERAEQRRGVYWRFGRKVKFCTSMVPILWVPWSCPP
jgi:hypothetical protein